MSEKIKITIVMHDEKPNAEKDGDSVGERILTQESSVTLMPVLLKNGLMDGSFCGGRGDCGRCVVQFLKGVPLPTGLERNRLEPEELRQGYRLACVTRPKVDCTVRIVGAEEKETPIVTGINYLSGKNDLNSQENNLSVNQKSSAMKLDRDSKDASKNIGKESSVISKTETDVIENSGMRGEKSRKKNDCYIIAVDLGTTTIAMQLRETATGAVADTYCEMNPQRRYGTDVLARIQASVEGHGEELRELVCGAIARGCRQFAEYLRRKEPVPLQEKMCSRIQDGSAGGPARACGEIACMCIAGNTTMGHLLLGYDVEGLGKSPFTPKETGLQVLSPTGLFSGLPNAPKKEPSCSLWENEDFPVYIAPCFSAFVGGDIVAGLYALGLFVSETSRDEGKTLAGRQTVLFVDLGTNGELAITDGRRMIVTATAAGPAFEGDGTMIGTDRIALTAGFLRRRMLDETGLLAEPYFSEGIPVNPDGTISHKTDAVLAKGRKDAAAAGTYIFKQEDIRALQMAKAAVRAGVEILWEMMGRPEIGQVCLAGGFGYYLDVEAAVAIGLLPAYMRGRVQAVGNTSLAGAYELGRDLFFGRMDAGRLEEQTVFAESVNLAETERFEGLYLQYMNLEENGTERGAD